MIFLRSHGLGFGRLRDFRLEFGSGTNLVFAENEGGKSTLQRFLVGLLYGQLRSDLRAQRRSEPWVEQYRPWSGPDYGGVLWCRLADGRDIEMRRSFGREETRVELRAATGEDITGRYEQMRNGEVLFAQRHLGLPKELFESVGMIRENGAAELNGRETVRDRIANLAQSGDEELSVRRSLSRLQEKLDSLGSERAPTKPYRQAMERVLGLQAEAKALEERRARFQSWIEDRNRIAGEIARLERELAVRRRELLAARRREAASRVRSLEEIDGDLKSLGNAAESMGARADFPAANLEELNRLVGARDSLARLLGEIRGAKAAALERLAAAEKERQELASYAPLASGSEGERITEWFVGYLSLSLQGDGLQKSMLRLRNEAGALSKRLEGLRPPLADPDADWQRAAREAAEDEQAAARGSAIVAEGIAREKSAAEAAGGAVLLRRFLAVVAIAGAAASIASPWIPRLGFLSPEMRLGPGIALLAAAAGLFLAAARSAKARESARQALRKLEADLAGIRDEGGKRRALLNAAMTGSGFQTIEEFLAAANQAGQDRRKLDEVRSRILEAEDQRHKIDAQSAGLYGLLKENLARVGLSCSPGSLKFQVDAVRGNLRRFRELDARYRQCAEKAEAQQAREAELADAYEMKCARIRLLLEEAGVDTPEAFHAECVKRQKLLELRDREESRIREFRRLSEGRSLEQWRERLRELTGAEEVPVPPGRAADDAAVEAAGTPLLPYQPAAAEAEEQEERVSGKLSSAREEFARVVERIAQAFQSYRAASQIEEDLAQAGQRLREIETDRRALGIALETIESLSRQQQEVLAPQLNAAVEQRFLRLCRRRYEEVRIDPDFRVWLRESGTGELRSAESLSRGTQDQVYFAMRFGILDLVSNPEEPCPSLLDEPFAAYDRIRMAEAFEVLAEEASRRQLILFTCREDLLELAAGRGARILRLPE